MKLFRKTFMWAILFGFIYVLFIYDEGQAGNLLLEGLKEQITVGIKNFFTNIFNNIKDSIIN